MTTLWWQLKGRDLNKSIFGTLHIECESRKFSNHAPYKLNRLKLEHI